MPDSIRSGVGPDDDVEQVEGCTLAQLRQLVLGPAGSSVVICFRRQTSPHAHFYFDVDMMRGSGEFLDVRTLRLRAPCAQIFFSLLPHRSGNVPFGR